MLVIGNGESRKNIDIDKIQQIKIGCNAIFRDWHVDHLICCDRKMVLKATQELNLIKTTVYTRPEYTSMHTHLKSLPELPYAGTERQDQSIHWGSGPYAVLLATTLESQDNVINLLGFDLYGTGEKINNVYKDSKGYGKSSDRAIDPRYWIYQLGKIFELNQNMKFIWFHAKSFIKPTQWNYTNLEYRPLTKLDQ